MHTYFQCHFINRKESREKYNVALSHFFHYFFKPRRKKYYKMQVEFMMEIILKWKWKLLSILFIEEKRFYMESKSFIMSLGGYSGGWKLANDNEMSGKFCWKVFVQWIWLRKLGYFVNSFKKGDFVLDKCKVHHFWG